MARRKNSTHSDVVIRLGDTIGFTGLRTYKVTDVDCDNNIVTVRKFGDDTVHTFPLDWLTDTCATFTNDCHIYMGHPVVWLPIPKNQVWYGFGYALPIDGGYAHDDSASDKFDGKNVIRDANGNPIPQRDHDYNKYLLYMSNPAKYYPYGGAKGR